MSGGTGAPVAFEVRLPRWAGHPAVRRHAVPAAGLLLTALVTALKAVALGGSYFFEDDLVFVALAAEAPLDRDFLTRVHIGHLMPGGYALVWVITKIHAHDWALASAMILVLHAGAGLAFLRLLLLLFGRRWMVLVPLVVALLAPATVQTVTWMAAAVNIVPLQIALCLALCSMVRLARGGGARHGAATLAWTLAGLVFFEKAVVIPAVLFAVTAWFLVDGGWAAGMGEALRRFRWLWAGHLALLGGYSAFYLSLLQASGSTGLGPPEPSVAADYALWFLVQTAPLLVTGAPVGWAAGEPIGPVVAPSFVTVVLAWAVLAAVVAVTVRHRRRAWRAWVLAAGFVVAADGLITLLARARFHPEHAFESRYIADSVPVTALCLALALIPLRGEGRPWRLPPFAGHQAVAAAAALCYAVSATVSAAGFVDLVREEIPRGYFANARTETARLEAGVQIYPTLVPEEVLFPWHGADSRLSSFLVPPALAEPDRERVRRPGPAHRGVTFDERGRLRPVRIFGGIAVPEDRDGGRRRCFPLGADRTLTVGLRAEYPGHVARIDYETRGPVGVTVHAGAVATRFLLLPEHRQAFFPLPVHREDLRITVDREGAAPCLRAVAVGAALPEEVSGGAG
ncbi:hypothetical protein [Planomonospora parontospora]|uniref:hypothetical protein n=1 Tax=Planomonospora parontospora TaxID=58119 RepID=UPI00166FD466|nr:hypothetical protein [Planomonospora parontospora]GGL08397.1 hypothetical protein GCM10014719_08050 [Planomonospora parontospora subsp. antibiotica]GII14540.1 hypothetical protein Ppa05_12660 [Planomonospora parontospora subsp. antibiotica]